MAGYYTKCLPTCSNYSSEPINSLGANVRAMLHALRHNKLTLVGFTGMRPVGEKIDGVYLPNLLRAGLLQSQQCQYGPSSEIQAMISRYLSKIPQVYFHLGTCSS